MTKPNYIDIKEFREFGFPQEANRQFFHPLGLALEVMIEDDGTEHLGSVWDSRDDPEGFEFSPGSIDVEKIARVSDLRWSKENARYRLLGSVVQEPQEGLVR